MIVSMTETNSAKYHKLFAEAYQFLKNIDDGNYVDPNGTSFNNIAEYYGHMADFIAQGSTGYKYIMLPLDEEVFEIDLNSRTIAIPSSFSKCASVQSDQLAETIVFIADRYFDYMDLASTEIYVQWVTPEDKKNGIKEYHGATRIEMIDIESEPGKIKFAWPLNDIITAVPGNVKFSIRFCRLDGSDVNKLFYSLNTTDDSFITIKPALTTIMDESKIEDPFGANLFKHAIINSSYATEGVMPPTMPEFSEPGSNIISSNGTEMVANEKVTHLNEDGSVTLYAQAYTSDPNSVVEYKWQYRADNSDTFYDCENYPTEDSFDEEGRLLSDINGEPVIAVSKEDKIWKATKLGTIEQEAYLVCDPQPTKRVHREVYYYDVNEGTGTPNYQEWLDDYFEAETPVYEKYTAFTVPADGIITGAYRALAWGITKITGKNPLKTPNSRPSDICIIPTPNPVEFNIDLEANKTLPENNSLELSVTVKEDPYKPELSYSWLGGHTNENSLTAIDGATTDTYTATEPGWYKVKVISTLNRTEIPNSSNICKVANQITPPRVTSLNTDEIYISNNATVETNDPKDGYVLEGPVKQVILRIDADVVTAEGFNRALYTDNIDENGNITSFKYIWQMRPLNGKYVDVTPSTSGVIMDATKPNEIIVTPRISEPISNFRCLVVNNLNGETAVFDHSGVGEINTNTVGTFVKEAPYVYENLETESFVFTIIRA